MARSGAGETASAAIVRGMMSQGIMGGAVGSSAVRDSAVGSQRGRERERERASSAPRRDLVEPVPVPVPVGARTSTPLRAPKPKSKTKPKSSPLDDCPAGRAGSAEPYRGVVGTTVCRGHGHGNHGGHHSEYGSGHHSSHDSASVHHSSQHGGIFDSFVADTILPTMAACSILLAVVIMSSCSVPLMVAITAIFDINDEDVVMLTT
jgi:hypothetical protein